MEKNQILLTHGTDARAMALALMRAADLCGMIGDKNKKVGVKPNLVVAKPAESGATTHPQIVEAVLEYLAQAGFRDVCVLEGSWVGARTQDAARVCGMLDVCRRRGVPFYDLQKDAGRKVSVRGEEITVCEKALELDFLVNLPVLKGHCQTGVTCALKNLKGLIPNAEKRRYHAMGLHGPIARLGAAFPNQFVLADNLCGDLDFEEGGNPVPMDRMIACADPVLTDAFACQALGFETADVAYVGLAEALGAGSADLAGAQIIALNQGRARKDARASGRVRALAGYADARDACSACYGSLIYALNRLDEEGALRGRRDKIRIGQGWRGQGGAIGVGRCAGGCDAALGGCPPKAGEIAQFLRKNWK